METGLSRRKAIIPMAFGYGLALLCVVLAIGAADPGGKDDPLVTMSYVKAASQFTRTEIAAGKGIKIGPGAEFVIVAPDDADVEVRGLDSRLVGVLDLTTGERAGTSLSPLHHYVNSGEGDQYMKFMATTTLILRGDWR